MALTEKQKEDIAARKAINEAKRAKKPTTNKAVKKKENQEILEKNISLENTQGTEIADKSLEDLQKKYADVKALAEQIEAENPTTQTEITPDVLAKSEEAMDELVAITQELELTLLEPSQEALQDVLEQEATNVLPEGENVSMASVDSLELIKEGQFKMTSEELSEIAKKGTELLLNVTPEQLAGYGKYSEHVDIGSMSREKATNILMSTMPPPKWKPDCSIDFTNGRSKPAISTQIGGYNTQEGTYFNKMMQEVVYILTLGGKFDRSVAPRFSGLPFSCKMKIPVDKYSDYVNRVGYPDYEVDKETYKVSLSAPDFRVLLNSLEKYVEQGWECDPKQAMMYKGRYVIPFRLRFPVEITAGLHCKVRPAIKYTVEELREMQWSQVRAIANLHGIEETNHNAVISQLMTIMENIDE